MRARGGSDIEKKPSKESVLWPVIGIRLPPGGDEAVTQRARSVVCEHL